MEEEVEDGGEEGGGVAAAGLRDARARLAEGVRGNLVGAPHEIQELRVPRSCLVEHNTNTTSCTRHRNSYTVTHTA